MSINKNNYEEFFMLYADKELGENQKREVEAFLLAHPEYQSEFDLLMSTVVPPLEPQKGFTLSLLKLPSGINAEEAMLLEVDGELSASGIQELDQLCMEYPQLEKDREMIKSLKLDTAEQLRFEDKSVLYRHESRVISIRMWKPAIAAALIGVGLFFGMNETNRVNEAELVGVQENGVPVQGSDLPVPGLIQHEISQLEPAVKGKISEATPDAVISESQSASTGSVSSSQNIKRPVTTSSVVSSPRVIETTSPVLENINKSGSNYHAYSPVSPEKETKMIMTPPDEIKTDVQRLTASKAMDANLAVQNIEPVNAATAEDVNSTSIGHVLIVDEEKVNRSKFGGFVRKVKRTIEKKANIKMPDEVRVAGFEITIK